AENTLVRVLDHGEDPEPRAPAGGERLLVDPEPRRLPRRAVVGEQVDERREVDLLQGEARELGGRRGEPGERHRSHALPDPVGLVRYAGRALEPEQIPPPALVA